MERYTTRQVTRALAQEQLLLRLDQGENFETPCQELDLALSRNYIPQLRRRYHAGGASWQALIDHRHGHAYKVTPERRSWLRAQKRENPALTQEQLAERFEVEFKVSISQSRVSDVLREEGVAIPGGQHYHLQGERALPVERAGVFFPPGGRVAHGRVEHSNPGDPGDESHLPGT